MDDWLRTFGRYDPTGKLGFYLATNDKSLVVSFFCLLTFLVIYWRILGLDSLSGYFLWSPLSISNGRYSWTQAGCDHVLPRLCPGSWTPTRH